MKKMRNKKGFSLAEMMIVIAIIVILAGATAVGVVSWLNNAKNAQNNVLSNNGDNFENAARLAVETAKGEVPEGIGESVTVNPVVTTKETTPETTKKEDPKDPDPKDPETTPATTPSTTPATTPATTAAQGGGIPGSKTITSAALPSECTFVSSVDDHGKDGGCTLKWNKDMTDCKKVVVTVTSQNNTFNRGWGMDNNPTISNGGHTITFVMEFNPYYTNPFQNGGTFSPNWGFDNEGDLKVQISVSVQK